MMADQTLYDIQQALGYLQQIAENTKRIGDILDEISKASQTADEALDETAKQLGVKEN